MWRERSSCHRGRGPGKPGGFPAGAGSSVDDRRVAEVIRNREQKSRVARELRNRALRVLVQLIVPCELGEEGLERPSCERAAMRRNSARASSSCEIASTIRCPAARVRASRGQRTSPCSGCGLVLNARSSTSTSSASWISSANAISRRPADADGAAREAFSRSPGTIGEDGIDGRAGRSRGLRLAPAQRAARSASRTDSPRLTISRAKRRRSSVVRDGEHGPHASLAELAALEHREHVLRQVEQAHAVRDRRLGPSDLVGDLAETQLELVDEQGVGPRLLDGSELFAGDVLDEPEQCLAVAALPNDRRDGLSPASRAACQRRSPAISP